MLVEVIAAQPIKAKRLNPAILLGEVARTQPTTEAPSLLRVGLGRGINELFSSQSLLLGILQAEAGERGTKMTASCLFYRELSFSIAAIGNNKVSSICDRTAGVTSQSLFKQSTSNLLAS